MQGRISTPFRLLLASALMAGTIACNANTPATPNTPSGSTASVQSAIQQFVGLSTEQKLATARALGNLALIDWVNANSSASASAQQTSLQTLITQQPSLATQLTAQGGAGGPGGPGMGGPMGSPPPGGMGPGGPAGLPPNFSEIQQQYPELATELEAMQSLTPQERQTKMQALLQEHPEWQTVLMPPGGGPGGPGGMPPGGMPPGPNPVASASPAS